jgi:oxygen-dependent protoporphyrinogen oxidase
VKYPGRAPAGHALLRVFLGGALDESALDRDDPALVAAARGQLEELLGARGEPLFTRVARYPRAMPQYHVGHLARVDAVERCLRRHPGLGLAGGAYRGVGIADCVRSAEEAAERALESFSPVA